MEAVVSAGGQSSASACSLKSDFFFFFNYFFLRAWKTARACCHRCFRITEGVQTISWRRIMQAMKKKEKKKHFLPLPPSPIFPSPHSRTLTAPCPSHKRAHARTHTHTRAHCWLITYCSVGSSIIVALKGCETEAVLSVNQTKCSSNSSMTASGFQTKS